MKNNNTMKNSFTNVSGNLRTRVSMLSSVIGSTLEAHWKHIGSICLLLFLGIGNAWGTTSKTFHSGDVLFFDFSSVTGGGGVNWQINGHDMIYDEHGAGTIKCVIFTAEVTWTNSWTIAKTAKGSWANITFPDSDPGSNNCLKINAEGTSASWTTHSTSVVEYVLSEDYVMVYGGEASTWNQTKYLFMDRDNSDGTIQAADAQLSGSLGNSIIYKYGPVLLPTGTYYQGHWGSGYSKTVSAGHAYMIYAKGNSSHIGTETYSTGDNSIYDVTYLNNSPTRTISTTIGVSSFYVGTSTLSVSTGSAGKSVVNEDNEIQYYLYNGSTWSEVTLSTGNLDVSSLTAGHYKLATVLYDGYIYVKADEDEFDVYDTWAMYSGSTKIGDFTTTDGIHYSLTDFVINNDNKANTKYKCSGNASYAQAGALSLLVSEASARTLTFDDGQIAWQDANGTYDIHIVYNSGWKIYAEQKSVEEIWYWIDGNGAHTGSEDVTKQLMDATAVSGVYSCTRTLTQNQTFHFGNTINGYWPKTPAQSDHTNVTATSSNIQLAGGGSTYWFQFTPASQPVKMTLNTNTDPYTISFSNPVYTITYKDQGGSAYSGSNGGSLPTSHTYGTATAFVDGVKTGYTFDGWFTDESCTISAGSSIGATSISANTTYYAKWTEKEYTVTLVNASETSVSAGIEGAGIEAPSRWCATFDHWEGTDGITFDDVNDATTNVYATKAGTATAVYTQSLYAYIEGRFHITNPSRDGTWTNTFSSGSWDQSSTAIQFDYDEENHVFYLHTYAKASELSSTLGTGCVDCLPYFFIKTSSSSSSLTDVTEYKMSSATQITDKGSSNGATFNSSATGDTNNANLRINSSDDTYLVTLYFNGTKVWYDYTPAVINNVALSATRVPPGVSITATPNMYNKGAVDKAYCWKLFSDEDCTVEVPTSFTSAGGGKVTFFAPNTRRTYYLRLQIHSTDGCNSVLDDEKVVSFEVTTEDMVFFKNVPNWGSVHVYFLGTSAYWDDKLGSGCKGRDNGTAHGMSRIDNTDIYYYDYHGNSNVVFDGSGKAYIAFTDNYKPNSNNFSGCQAAYRADFSECAPLYVPENYITDYKNTSAGDGQCAYYNRGYWTNYMSVNSGFTLHVYDKVTGAASQVFEHEFTGIAGRNTYTYTYTFTGEKPYTYGFKVEGCGGSWYGLSNNTMNINSCTNYNLYTDNNNCGLEITANLPHTFIFTLTGDGHVQMSIDYPLAVGDYRLVYSDNTHTAHPSRYIRARANGKDTISMWVNKDATDPILKVQKCTSTNPITWEDYNWGGGASPRIDISTCTAGVYNFYLEQNGSSALDVKTTKTCAYTGLYYIRTNSVDGGWISYKTAADNRMTYSQYSYDQGYGFDYYKTKWVSPSGSNVTYTIACDYSESLCDTLTADPNDDPLNASQASSIPQAANVRFGWNSKTNKLKRAYISGSTNISDRFLVLVGDENMLDKNGNALTGGNKVAGLNENEMNFTDLGNWIYRADIKAIPGAQVQLTAEYDNQTQYFIGTEEKPETIIGGDGGTPRLMRVIYDFKTNRLMTAWLPDGEEITDNITLKADMMLIREGQNAATQIIFQTGKSISEIHSIFGVMEFKKEHIAGQFPNWNADHAYEYLMYYISFPFDVKVRDIFGAGTFGENWIIQKYNGAKRAKIGWFAETSTFWETLTRDSTMHKYEGYLLLLDRISFNDPNDAMWYKIPSDGSIYLYFPSVNHTIGTINAAESQTITVPSHVCSIERTFEIPEVVGTLCHKNTDSHWNVIGTPLFATNHATTVGTPVPGGGDETLQYFYDWDYATNTLEARATYDNTVTFKSMHSYMVQYAGDVTFTGAHIVSGVAARRLPSEKNYHIELQLVNEAEKTSTTYVELRENACDTFALNEDMYMMRSSKTVDLYTFAGAYDVAANVLSENNHTVQVGMDVKQAGTYRFTMPSEFSGTVTLVDNLTGQRQNLALGDYAIYLEKGTCNNRFQLVINIENTTTSIEGTGSLKDGGAHKFLQNGVMYILRDGVIYDAQGKKVQ